ncbi:MAG TPA: VOC family protein [Candidatus Eremiobacteraceae bacterium]|jgi:predicted enzyme related to lactoylglutathione lyase
MAATTSNKVKAVDATYYTVNDIGAQTKFYTDLLGAEPTVAMPSFFTEWTFPGGGSFGLYKSESGQTNGGGVMFAVDDVKGAVAELKGRGVKFHDTIEDIPTCNMAFGTDPEGLPFILHHRKDGTTG